MPFTDEDLKKYQGTLANPSPLLMTKDMLWSLLARLKAAEKLAGAACVIAMAHNAFEDLVLLHEDWRTKAGK